LGVYEELLMTSEYLGEEFVKKVTFERRLNQAENKVEATHHYNDFVLMLGEHLSCTMFIVLKVNANVFMHSKKANKIGLFKVA